MTSRTPLDPHVPSEASQIYRLMGGETVIVGGRPFGWLEFRHDHDSFSETTIFVLDADKVIAMGSSSLDAIDNVCDISRFQVAVDYRRQGIGTLLFDHITADASERHINASLNADAKQLTEGALTWNGDDASTSLAGWHEAVAGGLEPETFAEPWQSFIKQMSAAGTPVSSLTLAPQELRWAAKSAEELADEGEAILVKYQSKIPGFKTASTETVLIALLTDLMHSVARSRTSDFASTHATARKDKAPGYDDRDKPTALRRLQESDTSQPVSSNQRAARGDVVWADEVLSEALAAMPKSPLHTALIKLRYAYARAEGVLDFDETVETAAFEFEASDRYYSRPPRIEQAGMQL